MNAVITAHVMASVPNFLISESMGPERLELYKELLKPPIVPEKGYLKVPEGPGFGVELNEDVVNEVFDERVIGLSPSYFPRA